jgi:hypothetical protein
MPKRSNRGGRNNNPTGRNQYSDWGVVEMARERPFAAAAAAVGAATAGLFLWSKRTQISDQLNNLTDQFGEWKASSGDGGMIDDTAGLAASRQNAGRSTQTSGGKASSGAGSRGRTKNQPIG